MTKPCKYLIVLTFLWVSCDKKDDPAPTITPPSHTPEPHYVIDTNGDSIRTGVPIPIKGRVIHPDSVAKPVTIPLRGSPKVEPAHENVRLAGQPKIVQAPLELRVVIPGEDSIPVPRQVEAKGKVVPASQPPPVPALPLRTTDYAKYNIKYLDVEQGLGSSFAPTIFEDSRGHLWFGTSSGGVSRYDGISFTHYGKKEGLSYTARVKLEDSQRNLWLKLDNGVARYDGQTFTIFTEKEGFNGTLVWPIIEDSKGDIWFGTNKGASRYEPGTAGKAGVFTHFTNREGLANGPIRGILEDKQGRLWFGGENGACFYDGIRFNQFFAAGGSIGQPLLEDSQGNLWFSDVNGGVIRYDGTHYFQYTREEGLIHNFVIAGLEDQWGNIWLGTHSGISCFDGTYFTNYTKEVGLSHKITSQIAQDRNGNLWFGTEGGGVNRLDTKNNFLYLPGHTISAAHADSEGNIWFGSMSSGAIRYDGKNFTYYTEKEGLLSNQVRTIAEDSEGALWFGTGKGASRYVPARDGTPGTFTNYTSKEGLSDHSINQIVKDKRGNLWFGFGTRTSGGGLCRYEPNANESRGKFVHFTDKEGMPNRHVVRAVNVDRQNNLWFNSPGGATYFEVSEDGEEGTLTYYSKNEGIIHERVRAIIEDQRDNIWFSTHGGVCYYDGHRFTSIPLKEGWWHHNSSRNFGRYNSMLEDHLGRIWVSRERALSLLIPQPDLPDIQHDGTSAGSNSPKDPFQVYDFGRNVGLEDIEFMPQSVSLDHKNRIFWGTLIGITMLDLNRFELPTEPPIVYLSHIELEGQFIDFRRLADSTYRDSLSFGKKLGDRIDSVAAFYNYPLNMELPHDLSHITFNFTAIDWAVPEEIKYSYLLEGLDNEWSIPKKENKADYRNLPPGNYTLKVKAIGTTWEWSEVFEYRFTIHPPWYWAWWSKMIYLLLFLGGLYGLYQFQLKRRLAAAETQRLRELDQVKTKLYTNITHEFRTPLTVIQGVNSRIRNTGETLGVPRIMEDSAIIKRNSAQLLTLVNQMLELRKLESGTLSVSMVQEDIINYLKYIVESFHVYAKSKNIRLHFWAEQKELSMDYDPEKLLTIVSNLLSNAIKFTKEGGDVYLHVENKKAEDNGEGILSLKIRDSGIGIPDEKIPHIFDRFYQVNDEATRKAEGSGIGLALTKELVHLLQGEIDVQSTLGEGTTFTVLLPITRDASPATTEEPLDIKEKVDAFIPVASKGEKGLTAIKETSTLPLVLLVEDNRDVMNYLGSCLENHYQLERAYNGQEGIDKAIKLVPDLIISDIMMPLVDGFELVKTLKTHELTNHIPILLLTAKADMPSKLEGLDLGADAYLSKPFHEEELLIRLKKLTELRKALQEKYQKSAELTTSTTSEVVSQEDLFLQELKRLLDEHLDDEGFGIQKICAAMRVSRTQLHRKVKALTNKSPSIYIRSLRLAKAKVLLQTTRMSVSEISYEVGFSSPAYFTQAFSEEFGVSPSGLRKD